MIRMLARYLYLVCFSLYRTNLITIPYQFHTSTTCLSVACYLLLVVLVGICLKCPSILQEQDKPTELCMMSSTCY